MKKRNRKNRPGARRKSVNSAPTVTKPAQANQSPKFNILSSTVPDIVWAGVILSVLANLKSLVEMTPTLDRLAESWTDCVEWPCKVASKAFGITIYPVVCVSMFCYLGILLIALRASTLERQHEPEPLFAKENDKRKSRAFFIEWWNLRWLQGLVAGSVASAIFVLVTDSFVLGNTLRAPFIRSPLWHWTMHLFALPLAVLFAFKFGIRRVIEIIFVGAMCGLLFIAVWYPIAVKARLGGISEIAFFQRAVLDYSLIRQGSILAGILAFAAPQYMMSRLLVAVGLVALVFGSSWVSTLMKLPA